jgi:hypothetical protein
LSLPSGTNAAVACGCANRCRAACVNLKLSLPVR